MQNKETYGKEYKSEAAGVCTRCTSGADEQSITTRILKKTELSHRERRENLKGDKRWKEKTYTRVLGVQKNYLQKLTE